MVVSHRYDTARIRVVFAVLLIPLTTTILVLLRDRVSMLSSALAFLILALVLGLVAGPRMAAVGALISFLAFDFFFLPPFHTLTINDTDHIVGLVVFGVVAVTAAILVGRFQQASAMAMRESRRTSLLYELNRRLLVDASLDPLLQTIANAVVDMYCSSSCRVLLAEGGQLRVAATSRSEETHVDAETRSMAEIAMTRRQPVGIGAERSRIRLPHGSNEAARTRLRVRDTHRLLVPIADEHHAIGVLDVTFPRDGRPHGEDDAAILAAFGDQVFLAVERTRLVEARSRAEVLARTNALQSALLAAVSHDLRTPLTAIKTSASAMLQAGIAWSDDDRTDLLRAIDEEADRLTLMVANLLDLSRLEGGALQPDADWHDAGDLIDDALRRTAPQTTGHRVVTTVADSIPAVWLDFVEIEQVLVNLISNAARYTPAGSVIEVSARAWEDQLLIEVADNGPGIPAHRLPKIFDRFYRGDSSVPGGSGIGLAICKGLVEAHGGSIRAESVEGEGTRFVIQLPLRPKPDDATDGSHE
jgi:two-component system sensor histidine kinase KdpD